MIRHAIIACLAAAGFLAPSAIAQQEEDAFAPKDCAEAAAWAYDEWYSSDMLQTCAKDGDIEAIAMLGMLYWGASASETCDDEGCTAGDPAGSGLDPALTIDQLYSEGRRLLELASSKDHTQAQNELGNALMEGDYGQPQDFETARKWLIRAADLGDTIAPYNLARIYLAGLGVERSTETAERYLRMSALRGYEPGRCSLYALVEKKPGGRIEAAAMRMADQTFHGVRCYPFMVLDELR